ncbi:STAS-like domain-containing protein [Methylomonas sp. AM2-LC]|uniref:STAS-like domain-containing protein n=1 Tax=Methylomonas sp. AM2-LC TaxID=3153301 RepID=UPI00326331B5
MFIVVKTITDVKIPQPHHGKKLAKLARECLAEDIPLTIDFEGVSSITQGFAQELLLPLVMEFGADFLNGQLHLVNLNPAILETINSATTHLDDYFDRLCRVQDKHCDVEIYELNLFWLVKVRELARDNAVNAQLMMGIAEEEMRLALSKLSIEDIHHIARSGWLCFSPRFTSSFIENMTNRQLDVGEILLAFSGSLC